MLTFKNALNNEDPLANKAELAALKSLEAALPLVLGNLAGIWTCLIAGRLGLWVGVGICVASWVISWYYHLCQTTDECFQFTLPDHVSIDHFTATSLLVMIPHYELNVLTVCQLIHERVVIKTSPCVKLPSAIKEVIARHGKKYCDTIVTVLEKIPSTYQDGALDVPRCGCGSPVEKHFKRLSIRENGFYDAWSSISGITLIVVVAIAVYAHPFSYAAFSISAACCLGMWFIKILLIEEGQPANFHGRISWPELIVSIILAGVGLTAYVMDSYVEYLILHSVWHVAIYLAMGFFLTGTMKSVNGWKPIITWKWK